MKTFGCESSICIFMFGGDPHCAATARITTTINF